MDEIVMPLRSPNVISKISISACQAPPGQLLPTWRESPSFGKTTAP
ncbi:hypothetical protein [Pseudomonas mucidolens]|uniref:Uncharacterized protein n=1 Tax=Pseudomonas mucidolens TaxID=46679 RepID=A0A1H2NHJ3_9PSED|nr:hypothetical protein [Pseudomonas mucidolens]SDV04276.1 hypothetical protein SAMN05216202_3638 [Pseudomonas mucidolens]SQH32021.1 Uncharacterised protein [Pseudomonas mucidolens]